MSHISEVKRSVIKLASISAKLAALSGVNCRSEQLQVERLLKKFEVKKRYWPSWPIWK